LGGGGGKFSGPGCETAGFWPGGGNGIPNGGSSPPGCGPSGSGIICSDGPLDESNTMSVFMNEGIIVSSPSSLSSMSVPDGVYSTFDDDGIFEYDIFLLSSR